MTKHLFFLLLLFPLVVAGQWRGDVYIAPENVTDWVADDLIEYQGVYHFGMSESESDLRVIVAGNKICIQKVEGEFTDDGQGNMTYVWMYKNLLPVKQVGSTLQMGKYKGRFVKMEDERLEEKRGLWIEDTWSGNLDGGPEIGFYTSDLQSVYEERFPIASIEILTLEQLKDYTKEELRVMRNEIFARYGYVFKAGGEMEAYFQAREWYRGQHRNVDAFLTEIEKMNIKTILTAE